MKATVLFFFVPESGHAEESLGGVAATARREGWSLHVLRVEGEAAARAAVSSWKPDGVLVGGRPSLVLGPDVFAPVPVVYLDHDPDPDAPGSFGKPIFCVPQDASEAGRIAARELASLGLASYAYVPAGNPCHWDRDRFSGFKSELSSVARGRPVLKCPFRRTDDAGWHRRLAEWLRSLPRPAGVLAANDRMAWETAASADLAGLSIPADMALVGVDNDLALCTNMVPDLTSVAPDYRRGGEEAAKLLAEVMADPSLEPKPRFCRPTEIVRRGSTDRAAAADPLVARARALIREKACEGLAVADVLAVLPGSRRNAERRFRAAAGRSILREINAVRLDKARGLLSSGSLGFAAVAGLCGWSSVAMMRRAFKTATGSLPSDWSAPAARKRG